VTVTFSEALNLHTRYRGDEPAASDTQAGFTYRQFGLASERLGRVLLATTAPGDRVVVAMASSAAYLVSVAACMRSGRVACPLNTRLSPVEAKEYLGRFAPALILTDEPNVESATSLGYPTCTVTPDGEALGVDGHRRHEGRTSTPGSPDAPAILFGTGGTTGTPKAAVYTHRRIWMAISSYMLDGKRTPVTHELTYSPFFHIALMAPLATLYLGGRVEVLSSVDPDQVLRGLDRGVSVIGGTAPTTWMKILDDAGFSRTKRSGLRSIFLGSAAVAPELVRRLLKELPDTSIFSGFGSTEHGTVSYARRPDLESGRLTGVGRPLPGVSVRVLREDGTEAEPGEPGELAVTTPWEATGYWGAPEETKSTWTTEGVRIGDIGRVDADGWLTLVGRKKEMIITGGENVFPSEVERVVCEHPDVAEAVVYGVPDAYWGERVEAAIVLRAGTPDVKVEALREWARPRLAAYKLPKTVVVLDTIPLTGAFKPDRGRLRRDAAPRQDSRGH
jgi:fatty-acyl-CoA synthase